MLSIYDRELQESTLFELFKSESYSDTLKALQLAKQEITNRILAIPDNTWTRKRLKAVQKQIDKEIAAAYAGTLAGLQGELPGIAEVTSRNVLLGKFTKVPTKVIGEITAGSFAVQGYEAKDLFKTISDNHARQLRVLVGAGVAQGKTSATIVSELITKNSKLSKGQLKNAIFTTITEARAKVRHASYKQLEATGVIEGYQYVATLDSRTTEYCRDHDNRIYRKNIDDIVSEINVHFHCRSVFAPLTKSSTATVRASTFGQVPDESYGTWFERQSDQFQRTTLGRKKFDAYKAGEYKIGGLPDVMGKVMAIEGIAAALNRTAAEIEPLTPEEEKALGKDYPL